MEEKEKTDATAEVITLSEYARIRGISRAAASKAYKQGKFKTAVRLGHVVLINRSELDMYR